MYICGRNELKTKTRTIRMDASWVKWAQLRLCLALIIYQSVGAPGMPYFDTRDVNVQIRVSEGESALFRCRVLDLGNYDVIWYKRGKGLRRAIVAEYKVLDASGKFTLLAEPPLSGTFDLLVTDVTREDEDMYQCSINTEPPNELNFTLMVSYPASVQKILPDKPPNRTPLHPGRVYFNESDNATLTCMTKGSPDPNVTWRKRTENRLLSSNKSVTIMNISRLDSGTYTCEANNLSPIDEPLARRNVQVVVQYPPEVQPTTTDIRVGPGKYLLLECTVNAVPRAEIYWMKDDINVSESTQVTDNRFAIISVKPKMDYGNYTCVAYNELGKANATIEVSGRPLKPLIISDKLGNRRHIYKLEWTPGANQNVAAQNTLQIGAYDILYRKTWVETDTNGRKSVHFFPAEPLSNTVYPEPSRQTLSYVLRDLSANSTYEGQICPRNAYGEGDCAEFQFITNLVDLPATISPHAAGITTNTDDLQKSLTPAAWTSGTDVLVRTPSTFMVLTIVILVEKLMGMFFTAM